MLIKSRLTLNLRIRIKEVLLYCQKDFGWGCSLSKAYILAWIIRRFRLATTVDIGVYRGRSMFPQALAHHMYTGGHVYGIDPYTKEDAEQYDTPELKEQFDEFFAKTDLERIYEEVEALVTQFEYSSNCTLIRERSDKAIHFFKDSKILIDLIHIDGNHDTRNVMRDLELYLPILKKNGFIVLDDISWKSVKPAYVLLLKNYSLVYKQTDSCNDYAVFSNADSLVTIWKLRVLLKYIARIE